MALTAQQFAARALRQTRRGLSEEEARLDLTQSTLLAPQARRKFSEMLARDPARRSKLKRRFELTVAASGVVDLTAEPAILVAALPFASVYDLNDVDYVNPYIYKPHASALSRKLDPNFSYFAVRDQQSLIVRSGGGFGNVSIILAFANYVWDFSGNNPLDPEFEDEAILTLATLLAPGLAFAKKPDAAPH